MRIPTSALLILPPVLYLTAVALFLFRGILVNPDLPNKALENHGFTNIILEDKKWFLVGMRGCDFNDAAKFPAKAINPSGKNVEIMVCTGWPFKGATLRTK